MVRTRVLPIAVLVIACGATGAPRVASAEGKVSIYLSRIHPADRDAERFSRTSWGGGIEAVQPLRATENLVALTAGVEISNMLSHRSEVYDPVLRENLEQSTSQSYGRFFVGGRLGPHGNGFLRPHLGANLAVVWYGISTQVTIPDPADETNSITRTLDSNYKAAFGYDTNAGIDLNIANQIPVEVGMRFLKTFNLPQPLGEGSVGVSPAYIQGYLAVGWGIDLIGL